MFFIGRCEARRPQFVKSRPTRLHFQSRISCMNLHFDVVCCQEWWLYFQRFHLAKNCTGNAATVVCCCVCFASRVSLRGQVARNRHKHDDNNNGSNCGGKRCQQPSKSRVCFLIPLHRSHFGLMVRLISPSPPPHPLSHTQTHTLALLFFSQLFTSPLSSFSLSVMERATL